MQKSPKLGIVIAYLSEKHRKKTKAKQAYYLLQLTPHLSLTKLYFQLTNQKTPTLKVPALLYLFSEKNKWGSKLKLDQTYLFHYQKQNNYLHLIDWKILGDQLSIKRAWQLIKTRECHSS